MSKGWCAKQQATQGFNRYKQEKSSEYTLTCLEDSIVVVGDRDAEQRMFGQYSQLETMIRRNDHCFTLQQAGRSNSSLQGSLSWLKRYAAVRYGRDLLFQRKF